MVSTLVRGDQRIRYPGPEAMLEAGDVLVLLGTAGSLKTAERNITGVPDIS